MQKAKLFSSKLSPLECFNKFKTPCPSSLNYFRVYFSFAYYFGISPFRFQYSIETDSFQVYSTKFQKIICALVQSFALYQYANLFRGVNFKTIHDNPNDYFELANVVGTLLYLLVLFSTYWLNKECFSNIFEIVQTFPYSSYGGSRKGFWSCTSLCLIFTAWSFYNVFSQNVAMQKWALFEIPLDYTDRAMFVYLFETNFTLAREEYNETLLASLSLWYGIIEFYQWLGTHFTDLLLLTTALFLREIATDFQINLRRKQLSSSKGLEYYKWLKGVIKYVNSGTGLMTLCVVVTALPYYASNAETVLETPDFLRRFRILFYCTIFFSTLAIAADANQKINEIKEWIMVEQNAKDIPQSTLIILVNDLSHIGMKGCEFFTVTFGFLGTIVSIVLTYAIIIVQFQVSPQFKAKSTR